MLVREACEKNEILKKANPATMAKMISYGMIRSYKKGELIFREREDIGRLYFLAEGYAALFRTNRNQDRKVIFISGDQDMLNGVILQEPVASASCIALTDVSVLTFSRKNFREMMEGDFDLAMAVMDSLAVKLRRCYHQLGNTPNAMRLDRQVASKLWKLSRDFGVLQDGMIKIRFELSVTFLADMVGGKRETVSRVVSRLGKEKLVIFRKNFFFVPDQEALRRYAMALEK